MTCVPQPPARRPVSAPAETPASRGGRAFGRARRYVENIAPLDMAAIGSSPPKPVRGAPPSATPATSEEVAYGSAARPMPSPDGSPPAAAGPAADAAGATSPEPSPEPSKRALAAQRLSRRVGRIE